MYILKFWFEWHHSESHSVHTSRRATSNPRSPPFSTNCACQPFDPFAYRAFCAFWYWFWSTIISKKIILPSFVSILFISFPDKPARDFLVQPSDPVLLRAHLGSIKIQGFIFANWSELFLAKCVVDSQRTNLISPQMFLSSSFIASWFQNRITTD